MSLNAFDFLGRPRCCAEISCFLVLANFNPCAFEALHFRMVKKQRDAYLRPPPVAPQRALAAAPERLKTRNGLILGAICIKTILN